MTVNTLNSVAEFVTNGVTTDYPFFFKFLDSGDLAVTYVDPQGVSTPLTLGTNYTVNGAGSETGGSITTNVALAGPGQLIVSREMDAYQQTALRNQGKFLAETHEDVFDRLTMLVQQGFSIFKRALTRPFGRDYFYAENRRITNVKDPEDIQDAATRHWTEAYFAALIDAATGLINTTTGILYDAGTLFDYLRFGVARQVDTIAALRLLSGSRNQRARVFGYYQRGDGGGGDYVANPADTTSADNGGSIIVANDGTRWFLQDIKQIKPEQFGALGDWNGTTGTNDDVAFQNLSAHLVTFGGGTVVISRPHYVPNGWTCNASGVRVVGVGAAEIHVSVILKNALIATNVSDWNISGVFFSTPTTFKRSEGGFGVFFVESRRIVIENCRTFGGTAGMWFLHCAHVDVRKSVINTTKADGCHFGQGSTNCRAIGNVAINVADDAFATTYYSGWNRPADISFIGNHVEGSVWGFGFAAYSADRVTIQGNTVSNVALGGCIITTHDGGAVSTDVTVNGNNFSGSNRASMVPNNYWEGTADAPIVSPLHKSCVVLQGNDVYAVGNKISDVGLIPFGGDARQGIMLNGGSGIGAIGNMLSSVDGNGIDLGTDTITALTVTSNAGDFVAGAGVFGSASSNLTTSASINHNSFGYGATRGQPYSVFITSNNTTRISIVGNVSSNGRGINTQGTNPNFLLGANYS